MEEVLGKDIVDGKIIEWSKLSKEDLFKLKEKLENKEKELLAQIYSQLETEE